MKCRQLSWGLWSKVMWRKGCQRGRSGLRFSRIPASWGSLLAFLELQRMQEQTMFSQLVSPPRSLGMTWSRFRSLRSKTFPQYWQVFLSR